MASLENPLVSVFMTAFNHEKYIAQAIESVLIQNTKFPIKIIIGEDFSTDNTKNICLKYYNDNSNKIELLLNKINLGDAVNTNQVLHACQNNGAKYIALLEGDDYWTDPFKLQKQIDFLEANPEYIACAHQTKVIYENNKTQSHLFKEKVPSVLKLRDILEGRLFHTASLVFRADIIRKHQLPINITAGDRALYFLIASFGSIYFFQDVMCVYRKNTFSLSSNVSVQQMKTDLNIIPWIYSINSKFPKYRYKSFIYKTIFTYPPNISFKNIFKYYILSILFSFSYFPMNIKDVIICTLKTLPQKIIKKRITDANI